jgi:hypothetical protein
MDSVELVALMFSFLETTRLQAKNIGIASWPRLSSTAAGCMTSSLLASETLKHGNHRKLSVDSQNW